MAGHSETSSGQYLHAAEDVRLESRPLPAPAADEVQVAIKSTTLCGSDIHYYRTYRNGTILVREPLCLGHESAGSIVAVGADAAKTNPRLRVGAAVALEVGVPCDQCDMCARGRYNICPNLRFRSSGSKFPHYQGTLQERVNHPVRWVHELPEELGFEIGALLEPLAVAIHAVRRSELVFGGSSPPADRSALVFGAGPVGLLCAVAAQAAGFGHIVICDIDPGRLEFAVSEGFASATYLVKPKKCDSLEEKLAAAKEVAADIADLRLPDGIMFGQASTTFECTGIESSIQASIYATSAGGSVILAGLGVPNHTLPLSEASAREISLLPTWRYANAYPQAIEIARASIKGLSISGGRKLPDLRKLISHRFQGLETVGKAFETACRPKDDAGTMVMKVAVNT